MLSSACPYSYFCTNLTTNVVLLEPWRKIKAVCGKKWISFERSWSGSGWDRSEFTSWARIVRLDPSQVICVHFGWSVLHMSVTVVVCSCMRPPTAVPDETKGELYRELSRLIRSILSTDVMVFFSNVDTAWPFSGERTAHERPVFCPSQSCWQWRLSRPSLF